MVFFSNFVKAPGATEPSANPGMTKKHANTSKLAVGESRLKQDIYILIYIYIYHFQQKHVVKKKSDCTPKMEKFGRKNSGAPKFAPEPWGQTCQVFIHHQLEAHWKHRKKSWKTHRQDTFRRKRYASVSCHGSDFQDFAGRPATSSSYAVRSFISPSEASWDQNQQDFQAPWPPYIPQPASRKKPIFQRFECLMFSIQKNSGPIHINMVLTREHGLWFDHSFLHSKFNQVNGCQWVNVQATSMASWPGQFCQISGLPCLPSKNFPEDATNLKKSQESTDPGREEKSGNPTDQMSTAVEYCFGSNITLNIWTFTVVNTRAVHRQIDKVIQQKKTRSLPQVRGTSVSPHIQ